MAERAHTKVAIVGAGICGLSTAIRLQDADPSLDITIIAEKFSPNTTSDGAAGFWCPTFMEDTPMESQRYLLLLNTDLFHVTAALSCNRCIIM